MRSAASGGGATRGDVRLAPGPALGGLSSRFWRTGLPWAPDDRDDKDLTRSGVGLEAGALACSHSLKVMSMCLVVGPCTGAEVSIMSTDTSVPQPRVSGLAADDVALFAVLIKEAPIGFAFFDGQLRCARVNEGFAEVVGASSGAEIVG